MMAQTIIRVGNSAGVRIPKSILLTAGMKIGQPITITAASDGIVVKPAVKEPQKISLEDLFKEYHGEYKGEEIDWGEPVGKEVF